MSNPWDVPPLPTRGDEHEEQTYIGVGRVITHWERIEFELSRLRSIFVDQPDEFVALQQYGEPRIFRERLDALGRAANAYFVRRPSQNAEGAFCALVPRLLGFAERRNDVAHGIVYQIHLLTHFRRRLDADTAGTQQYALIPPLYALRRHDDRGAPKYAYTSETLHDLAAHLVNLEIAILGYREEHLPTTD